MTARIPRPSHDLNSFILHVIRFWHGLRNTLSKGKNMKTDIAHSALPLDQSLVLGSLNELAMEDRKDTQNLWNLAKNALIAVRKLQMDLNRTTTDLQTKKQRIEELEALITTDELTKILNRRGFVDMFERELDRTNREVSAGGILIMIDLDNFKAINDTYGHGAGDKALQLVAQTLSLYIRKMDCAARLGGDEFIVLFSNTTQAASLDRAQKLARKLNRLTLKCDGHRIPIRASIGIEPYNKGNSMEGIFNKADEKMYKDKETKETRA